MMKLSDFVTLFARFTLPNGRTRWLPADLARKDSPFLDGYTWGFGFWVGDKLEDVVATHSRQEAALHLLACGREAWAPFLRQVANACEHSFTYALPGEDFFCLDCRSRVPAA